MVWCGATAQDAARSPRTSRGHVTGRQNMKSRLLSMGVALIVASAGAAGAQQSGSQARTVQGVWYVQVTIRDCATGAALAPPVNSLVTFAAGGTLHESVGGGGFAPGQRSDGHGTWTHGAGQTYDQRFVAMINFASPAGPGPGFDAGWLNVHHTVEMIDADHIESSGTNVFTRRNGDVYRTGCSTATGTRFE
jgi:hypothetical protein